MGMMSRSSQRRAHKSGHRSAKSADMATPTSFSPWPCWYSLAVTMIWSVIAGQFGCLLLEARSCCAKSSRYELSRTAKAIVTLPLTRLCWSAIPAYIGCESSQIEMHVKFVISPVQWVCLIHGMVVHPRCSSWSSVGACGMQTAVSGSLPCNWQVLRPLYGRRSDYWRPWLNDLVGGQSEHVTKDIEGCSR